MDVRTQFPRSLRDRLGPYVHLGRMIDKCRAHVIGVLGEYRYPCPLDAFLLEFIGINAEDFLHAVRERTDQEVLQWVQTHGTKRSEPEIHEWNTRMLNRGPDTPEKWDYFLEIRNAVDSTRQDVVTWADLLDLEEGRTVSLRSERGN